MQQKQSLFGKIVVFVNLFFALFLLFLYVVPYIEPKQYPRISVLSLITPLLLVVNIFFAIYWIIRRRWFFVYSAGVLIIGYNHLTKFVQMLDFVPKKENTVKLMSFNARLFNHYNWHSDKDLEDKIMNFIDEQNPDIIVFQEFYKNKKYEPKQYPYKKIVAKKQTDQIGHAFFSKFPIVSATSLRFPKTGNNGVYADVIINQDTVRIYSLHLESLHLNPEKDELLNTDKKRLVENIGKRFAQQQQQMEIFKAHKEKSPYRNIVCGDFNNTAHSYIYRQIKGTDLKDAFEEGGWGLGRTFNFKYFPFRIDYILLDKSFTIYDYQTFNKDLSDHFPVMVSFE